MGAPKLKKTAITVVKDHDPRQVIELLQCGHVHHVVQENGYDFANELRAAEEMEHNPELFLKDPLSVILARPDNVAPERFSAQVLPGEKKSKTMGEFDDFLKKLTGVKTISEQARMISDEIFTNALKSSPDGSDGEVEFFAEAYGGRLVIGARDSFGSLKIKTLIERLRSCYEIGVAQSIRHDTAGAGIGTFMIFDSCVSYYAAVKMNHATIVCAVLPMNLTRRQAEDLPKNIHLLEIK